MALVRAVRDCYVDCLRREGDVFEYNGPKNGNLVPAKKKVATDEDEKDSSQSHPAN